MYSLGWKKDPADDRDHDAVKKFGLSLGAAPATVPTSCRNADLVKVRDQKQEGACTSFSTSQAVRAAQILEAVEIARATWIAAGNDPAKFDPTEPTSRACALLEFWAWDFPYFLARGYDGTTKEDAGTNIRTIFQAINKFGFPPASAMPYVGNTDPTQGPVVFDKMPPADVFRRAYDQRASAENVQANVIDYARITEVGQARVDAIKLASSQRHLIVFGTLVTEAFCSDSSANGGNPIQVPSASAKIAGGHAMVIAGYDADGVDVPNSWSTDFGGGGPTKLPDGWCRFSWEYMTWAETTDLWIVRRSPLFVKAAA